MTRPKPKLKIFESQWWNQNWKIWVSMTRPRPILKKCESEWWYWAKDVDNETPPRLSLISALFFFLNVYLGAPGLSCELGWSPSGPRRWLFKYLFCYSRVPGYSLLSRVWITSGVLICARCPLMFPRKRYHPVLLLLFLYHLPRFSPVTLWLSP